MLALTRAVQHCPAMQKSEGSGRCGAWQVKVWQNMLESSVLGPPSSLLCDHNSSRSVASVAVIGVNFNTTVVVCTLIIITTTSRISCYADTSESAASLMFTASISQDGLARGVLVDLAGAWGRTGFRDLAALWQGAWFSSACIEHFGS